MNHWQFYLAIALLVFLSLPIYQGTYEGVTGSYPFELSPEQTKILNKLLVTQEDEDEIIRLMTPLQMQKIPEIKKDNYEKLYQITNLTPETIQYLPPEYINSLNEPHFKAFLRQLKKNNVLLNPKQLNGLSQTKINMIYR
jgi:hypothetical protein